ncbi:TetR/AcrR family transcriptional regulator C-terminal ligand-binding domain-containing protein [Nocardia sp. CA-135398]|uniref:TetR/AcrR family transcriptional regulator C-terminal ligand-binding domain-containing protein n=1 Tax=Nocardia sp. CA-135398 TaxID=3239977 RepID=UPI003D95CCF8
MIARGNLPDIVDVEQIVHLAVAPIYYRPLVTHEALTTQDTVRAADSGPAAARVGAI